MEPSGLVSYLTVDWSITATWPCTPRSCETLTASLSAEPAATPVIWRNWPLAASPTDTAASVLVVAPMAMRCASVAVGGT
ncbi:hypothetical protein D9M68_909040 [compost metagenome]